MICALCNNREADKTNTHFLTDGVIRSCLNLDGSKERSKGLYFDLSNDKAFIEFNFQQDTPVDKIEDLLGRQLSEEEIEKAMSLLFSVDNIFCTGCESLFTAIESKFIAEILPKFRSRDLSETSRLYIKDIKLIRLFFYLQIWRTAICDTTFPLSSGTSEKLRIIILNGQLLSENEINDFPLSITYLETVGGEVEYTTNYVGYIHESNPNLILMNDFVIQFYDDEKKLRLFDFYGLNAESNIVETHNYKEQIFVVSIFNNAKRKKFLSDFITNTKVKQTILFYKYGFEQMWLMLFGAYPSSQITQECIMMLAEGGEENILKYSKENITNKIIGFIQSKIK